MDKIRTAILVDGGFYRKRAKSLWGEKSAKERAKELESYCHKHVANSYLYRIFIMIVHGLQIIFLILLQERLLISESQTYLSGQKLFMMN